MVEDSDFEVLTPTEVEANFDEPQPEAPQQRIRKLCACGCGEEVTGNRALKRGHQMGDGLSASVFSGNDILVFQTAFVALVGAITAGIENKTGVPRTEPEESQAIGQPLGRIAARHIPKALLRKMKPGDAADALLIGTTITAYIVRITTTPKPVREAQPVASNGQFDNQTVSGLNQYQYRSPEQTVQSQNGGTH